MCPEVRGQKPKACSAWWAFACCKGSVGKFLQKDLCEGEHFLIGQRVPACAFGISAEFLE